MGRVMMHGPPSLEPLGAQPQFVQPTQPPTLLGMPQTQNLMHVAGPPPGYGVTPPSGFGLAPPATTPSQPPQAPAPAEKKPKWSKNPLECPKEGWKRNTSYWQPDGTFRADSMGPLTPLPRPRQHPSNPATLPGVYNAYANKLID